MILVMASGANSARRPGAWSVTTSAPSG